MQKAAAICLSLYLLLSGILTFIPMEIPYRGVILAVLAIAAGVLILLTLKNFAAGPQVLVVLGIALILMGLNTANSALFPYQATVTAIFQIVAGVLMLVRGGK